MPKAKILVVDDDPDFVETRTILESDEYQVISAGNSDQGMRTLSHEKPDLVVLDVIMSTCHTGEHEPAMPICEFRHVPIMMVTSIANTDYLALFPDGREHPHRRVYHQAYRAPELLRQIR